MKNIINAILLLSIISLGFSACSDDDDNTINTVDTLTLELNITGLENLGDDFKYEGWMIVDGAPVTTGLFDVDNQGNLTESSFELNADQLAIASAFVLTIEPSPDPDPAPSAVHILAGDISNNQGQLTIDHASAIGHNFESSTGNYILATPTDGANDTDEFSGVWWLDPTAGPAAGLSLPTLPEAWIYEGWAVVNGTPISTGRFSSATETDDFSGFSGANAGPPFPGEDLLNNAPAGLEFPIDLRNQTIAISVEPVPDNSAAPFLLKPLLSTVPGTATDHSLLGMNNNAINTNPTGSISIK